MPITNLRRLPDAEYADLRYSIISQLEGTDPLPYFDNAAKPLKRHWKVEA